MLRLKKLKSGLARLRTRLKAAFTKGDSEELEELLIGADMGVELTGELIAESGGKREKLAEIITRILEPAQKDFSFPARPTVVMIAGTNGSGKTTTVAKLATLWRDRNVLIAAADTYRDAAGLQLERWARRTDTDLVTSKQGQDAGAVVYDALNKAIAKNYGVVLLDTAGRLHTRRDLMAEADKIRRVSAKVIEDAPHEVLLVMDASSGQNGLRQVEGFTETLGVTGLIVTKLDGTSKAGVLIPIVKRFGLPIYYIGVGEDAADIICFNAREFTQALLGE